MALTKDAEYRECVAVALESLKGQEAGREQGARPRRRKLAGPYGLDELTGEFCSPEWVTVLDAHCRLRGKSRRVYAAVGVAQTVTSLWAVGTRLQCGFGEYKEPCLALGARWKSREDAIKETVVELVQWLRSEGAPVVVRLAMLEFAKSV